MIVQPIITKQVSAGTRIYYLDVHIDKKGQRFLAISEINTSKTSGKKKRQRIFIHAENIDKFAEALVEVANFIKNDTKR